MTHCLLCQPTLGPVLAEGKHWRVILNRNQNLLGKLMVVLRRPEEWAELHLEMRRAEQVLSALFAPDHFNHLFLQNQDRHVHLHVVPRYASGRPFASLTFGDPDYPAHYAVPSPVRRLGEDTWGALALALRREYGGLRASKG